MTLKSSELLEHSQLGILVCDLNDRIDWCNDIFVKITGLEKHNIEGNLFTALPFESTDNGGFRIQLFDKSSKGSTKFLYWRALTSNKSQTIHYYAIDRQIESSSVTSGHSSIAKRPNWIEYLNYEVSRSRRYGNSLCILKLQLLTRSNPDEVSNQSINQAVNDALVDCLRWADMISTTRSGGFLMVLPETPVSSINSLTDKLSNLINAQLELLSSDLECRLFFGQSCWQQHDDSQLLLARARNDLVENLEKSQ